MEKARVQIAAASIFVHSLGNATRCSRVLAIAKEWKGLRTMPQNRFAAREAAAALLRMAQTTSDPKIAAGLIDAAAILKEQAGELPPSVTPRAPDVITQSKPREPH